MNLYIFGTFVVILDCIITMSSQEPVAVVHPQHATVYLGGNTELRCKFNETISRCVWFRNGTAIIIKERYKYKKSDDNGINTTDCTIEISEFSRIDATHWQCSCAATDNINKTEICMSNYGYLNMNPSDATEDKQTTSEITVHPQNVTAMHGSNITLRCKFNGVIPKCVWYRKDTPVHIKGRYKYLNSDDDGENTKDCSIEITGFVEIDATRWQCTHASDSSETYKASISHPAHLTMKQSEITVHPQDADVLQFSISHRGLNIVLSSTLVAVIAAIIVYCIIRNKDKKKAESDSKSTTTETPQSPPGPEFHDYTYISTPEDASEEDPNGYLIPKDATVKGSDSESQPKHDHIYLSRNPGINYIAY